MKFSSLLFLLVLVFKVGYAQQDTLINSQKTMLINQIEQVIDSSTVYYNNGVFTKSLMSNIKLLELAKELKDPRYLSKAHRFLAYDFLVVDDTLLARENFENSRKYAEIFNDNLTVGQAYMDLANYHSRSDLNYNKALKYHDLSIEKIAKSKDSTELAKAYYNAIITAFYSEQFDLGKKYLDILMNRKFDKFKLHYFFSSEKTYLARYYNEKGEYLLAKKEALEALEVLEITKDSGTPAEKYDCYEQLAVSYYGQKKFKDAYDYRLLSEQFFDESQSLMYDEQSQAALAKLKVELYKNEIADQKEKTLLQEEIAKNKNNLNNFLLLVCLSGLLLFVVLLVAYLKRRDLNLALRRKNEEYLQAKEKSELLAKAKSKFFSTVSHELRTPLYGVIGLSTILLEDPELKSHERDLKSLKFSADYLLALINDVLQINKIDSNNIDNEHSQFNIRDFIKSITTTFEYMRLQNKNIINVNIDSKIPENLEGNVITLSQILMNIVGNALKFTENGTITIKLELLDITEDNYNIEFSISDTGIGIPKDKQATIFDEFTQVDSLNYVYQGTGLGLPIVKKLLQASNSEIKLESELDVGTTMTFNLGFKSTSEKIISSKKTRLNESLLKGKKILVAEDNRINQIVTKKILEKKGVICTLAENGEIAVEFIKNNDDYDLILMDLNMPILNGFEATIEIRTFNKNIPIIALTAVEVEEVRNEIYAAGMNDIIIKPYDDSKFTLNILENLNFKR